MSDVGLGQLATVTGRARMLKLADAVRDSIPVYEAMDDAGGILEKDGGRSIVLEGKTGQNSTVAWVGESGATNITDDKVLDAAEFTWRYLLGSVSWSLAERYMNDGGSDTKYIDLLGGKFEVLEDTCMNILHAGMLSNGTGSFGLQLVGLAALVSTTPTTGTVGTIDRSAAAAAWYRNQKFDTSGDWADGAVDAGNVKRFLDKGLNATSKMGRNQVQIGLMGQTHYEFLTSAIGAQQQIVNVSTQAKSGFSELPLIYRGVPFYLSGGVNYSGQSAQTATRTYLLNVKPGGVNLHFHRKARFAMLEPFESQDQAAGSRLMFSMLAMTIGPLAKHCWVGFD